MWRQKALTCAGGALRRLGMSQPSRAASSNTAVVNSVILRSLKDHYVEVSKMPPPPKYSPPAPFTVVKGALHNVGPVLKGGFKDEEISVSVMQMAEPGVENDEDSMNQLFIHVDISKPGQKESLRFLCGLYPDALGIHSVMLGPKEESFTFNQVPSNYGGPVFEEVGEKVRDALHSYIEERGITEKLFPFLQAWLYVKDHKNLMRWYKTVGTFVSESGQDALKS